MASGDGESSYKECEPRYIVKKGLHQILAARKKCTRSDFIVGAAIITELLDEEIVSRTNMGLSPRLVSSQAAFTIDYFDFFDDA